LGPNKIYLKKRKGAVSGPKEIGEHHFLPGERQGPKRLLYRMSQEPWRENQENHAFPVYISLKLISIGVLMSGKSWGKKLILEGGKSRGRDLEGKGWGRLPWHWSFRKGGVFGSYVKMHRGGDADGGMDGSEGVPGGSTFTRGTAEYHFRRGKPKGLKGVKPLRGEKVLKNGETCPETDHGISHKVSYREL